jgi:predicted outer membrane lipoprotein
MTYLVLALELAFGVLYALFLELTTVGRVLALRLASGSRMLPPLRRPLEVKLGDATRTVVFEGRPVEVRL